MKQQEKIKICIDLINWIEDEKMSNEEILFQISSNDYLAKAEFFDKCSDGKIYKKSLVKIIQNMEDVLRNADPTLPIHNQRYACDFLTIESYLLEACDDLALSTQELFAYLSMARDDILQLHFSEYIAEKLLLENEVKQSFELFNFISNKQYHYEIFRKIAKYYAENGDQANFMNILKKCDARKDVFELESIKEIFIENYALKNDLNSVLRLIERKEFGKKYLVAAMMPYTQTYDFEEVRNLVSLPIFDEPKLYLKQIILTYSFTKNKKNQTIENFEYLKNLLSDIPAKVRFGNSDFSMRDNLWSFLADNFLANDIEQYQKEWDFCVKKINSNVLKRATKAMLKPEEEI